MLEGSTLAWLNSLPESNIHDWKDLCDTFIKNFEGMYAWPGTAQDLWNHVQKDGESVREFINHGLGFVTPSRMSLSLRPYLPSSKESPTSSCGRS